MFIKKLRRKLSFLPQRYVCANYYGWDKVVRNPRKGVYPLGERLSFKGRQLRAKLTHLHSRQTKTQFIHIQREVAESVENLNTDFQNGKMCWDQLFFCSRRPVSMTCIYLRFEVVALAGRNFWDCDPQVSLLLQHHTSPLPHFHSSLPLSFLRSIKF